MEEETKKKIKVGFIILTSVAIILIGIILTKPIYQPCGKNIYNVEDLDAQVKEYMPQLLGEDGTGLVIRTQNRNTVKLVIGTKNFGIAIGFTPTNPNAWGTASGCNYNIEAMKDECINCCLNQGWLEPEKNILTGTNNVYFDEFERSSGTGYSIIKIDIPKKIEPCLQRFKLTVNCQGYPDETISDNFDIVTIKKGFLCF